jgi:hypothetical protein
VDGKLYFNWAPGVKQMFLKNKEQYIKDADGEWHRVKKELLEGKNVHWMFF